MTADTMRLLLALAAEFGFEIHQLDVVTAYLNAVLEEELYMSAPLGIAGLEGCLGLKLLKALYGLKQAAYLWHLCRQTLLIEEQGFRPNDADCCVSCVARQRTPVAAAGGDGSCLAIGTHVDDLLLTTGYPVSAITHRLQGVKLETLIKQDLVNGTVHLSQQHYIDELLGRFLMQEAWPLLTPAERSRTDAAQAPAMPAEISAMATTPYRPGAGRDHAVVLCRRHDAPGDSQRRPCPDTFLQLPRASALARR
ncbi:unnamed protein product [Phaeothamnion confervicola]